MSDILKGAVDAGFKNVTLKDGKLYHAGWVEFTPEEVAQAEMEAAKPVKKTKKEKLEELDPHDLIEMMGEGTFQDFYNSLQDD